MANGQDTQQGLTLKAQRYAEAILAGATTQKAAAEYAGITPGRASQLRRDAKVARYIEAAKTAQGDNARSLAAKSLARGHKAIAKEVANPLDEAQLAAATVTVAQRYAESFGSDDDAVDSDDKQLHMLVIRCTAVVQALRIAAKSPHRIAALLQHAQRIGGEAQEQVMRRYVRG